MIIMTSRIIIIIFFCINVCYCQNNCLFPKSKSKIANYAIKDTIIHKIEDFDSEDWAKIKKRKPIMYLFYYSDINNSVCSFKSFDLIREDWKNHCNYSNFVIEDNTIYCVVDAKKYLSLKNLNIKDYPLGDISYLKEFQKSNNKNIKIIDEFILLPLFYLDKKDTSYTYPHFFPFYFDNHDVFLDKVVYNEKLKDTIYLFNLQTNTKMNFFEGNLDYFYLKKIEISKQYGFLYIEFYRYSEHYQFWYNPYTKKIQAKNKIID